MPSGSLSLFPLYSIPTQSLYPASIDYLHHPPVVDANLIALLVKLTRLGASPLANGMIP
jgi:hypothetical protein